MANLINTNKRLRKTYNAALVRRFDEARVAGAKALQCKPEGRLPAPPLLKLCHFDGRGRGEVAEPGCQ